MRFLLIVISHKENLENILIVYCIKISTRIDDGENFEMENLYAEKKLSWRGNSYKVMRLELQSTVHAPKALRKYNSL
jgi:hypothetical protein